MTADSDGCRSGHSDGRPDGRDLRLLRSRSDAEGNPVRRHGCGGGSRAPGQSEIISDAEDRRPRNRSANGAAGSSNARSNGPGRPHEMRLFQTPHRVPSRATGSPPRFRPSAMPGVIAGNAGGRVSTAEVLVLLSLSVPAASWRQWAQDAAGAGAPLVLRGVGEGGLPGTAQENRETGSAARKPGSRSTQGCSVSSESKGCPSSWSCPAACRPAAAGAARRIPRRPTTGSPGTSGSSLRCRRSSTRAPSPATWLAATSNAWRGRSAGRRNDDPTA